MKQITLRRMHKLAGAMRLALDPSRAPSKVKTFADMSPAEQSEMKKLYERRS